MPDRHTLQLSTSIADTYGFLRPRGYALADWIPQPMTLKFVGPEAHTVVAFMGDTLHFDGPTLCVERSADGEPVEG
ncbi:hypothetical protein [Streptomyces sp. NPDC002952]|uniref:hypothetical protein n=1 Tax=Streptomyces sp. NPDC002952 TaxID=3364673 RepID=UPI0036D12C50